ncbi:hypothetical protein AUJ10_03755 [Candidatus Pacearchaeota archaeon CG1_02_31_27]|nr:MAG: hypothetical protein AUJ10_03755 [Candidatus Pacearchaeota archaeon CG1_02_31_27]
MGEKFIKKYEKYVAGIILAILFLLVIYSANIIEIFEKEPQKLSLFDYSGNLDIKFIEAEKDHLMVPDYDATLYINPVNSRVNQDNIIEFSISVEDKGIIKLNDSYYYLFLFDSEDNLRAVFPTDCDKQESTFSVEDFRCHDEWCYYFDGGSKFKKWDTDTGWYKDGKSWECTSKNPQIRCISQSCYNKQELLFDNSLVYTYKPDKIGTWKIYGVIFEEEYKKRDFKSALIDNGIYNNAIELSKAKIEVVNEKVKNRSPWWFFQQAIIIAVTFFGSLGLCIKFYEFSKKVVMNNKGKILLGIIILISLIIIAYIFCKIGCP